MALDKSQCLRIRNLNLYLNNQPLLKNIHFEIKKNEIVGLIGPVGSGKSLLLKSLMKETPFVADQLSISNYSYLPQEPFILSATILENIIFDYSKVTDDNYKKSELSLQQAQFDIEKDRVKDGLKTIIGERGLNISGGQKQRLNLARLFYNPQPLFLLDDPFSAVDIGTEKKIIDVFLNLKNLGHSFLVVTQRYEFLKSCDRILFMDHGELLFNGSYADFIKQERFAQFIRGEDHDEN